VEKKDENKEENSSGINSNEGGPAGSGDQILQTNCSQSQCPNIPNISTMSDFQ